uniref:Uncharacterized protein n=1 Tax=Zonotrichia albicollis TaxID=44394 RepID=A0A8D2MYU2_ZONAL
MESLSVCLHIWVLDGVTVCLSAHLGAGVTVSLSVCTSGCWMESLSPCLSAHLGAGWSHCLSVCLHIQVLDGVTVSLSVCTPGCWVLCSLVTPELDLFQHHHTNPS